MNERQSGQSAFIYRIDRCPVIAPDTTRLVVMVSNLFDLERVIILFTHPILVRFYV